MIDPVNLSNVVFIRFDLPEFNNLERWFNRIVNNLLYYQTNYFLSAILIFLVLGFLHPSKMILGITTLAVGRYWTDQAL